MRVGQTVAYITAVLLCGPLHMRATLSIPVRLSVRRLCPFVLKNL